MSIRRVDLRGQRLGARGYRGLLPRAGLDIDSAITQIEPTLRAVREAGAAAERVLLELSQKFDGVTPPGLRVPTAEIARALHQLSPEIRTALELAITRVRAGHQGQVRSDVHTEPTPGGKLIARQIPIQRVGLYVPGGRAVYPSSVIMNVVPAQIAGVASLAVASPPQKEFGGLPHPTVLAACALLGVEEVYAVGGAQAIAMFAYGAPGVCEPVDLVTGPGNIYVAAAKRALRGLIAIDSEAGPTEIAVVADESANAAEVAADLISQAEHDTIAAAVLITPSAQLLEQVELELIKKVAMAKHHQRIATALAGIQSALVLVDDLPHALEVANAYAAEHLEIITKNAAADAAEIFNAGAVFIGRYSPVSLGDYAAGSNHVLPTGGCACHSSGLSVQSFLKNMTFIEYDQAAFNEIAGTVITLAEAEDLPAHGQAISARFEGER